MNATPDQVNADLDARVAASPFLLENEPAYRAWRERKLEARRLGDAARVFTLDPAGGLDEDTRGALQRQVDAFNFFLFEVDPAVFGKPEFIELNGKFGLQRADLNPGADADRVTSLRVLESMDARAQYIPYTNRAMNWHTDGYYNTAARRINAFTLYCVQQARRGGGNYLFDHEMMYLLVRDQSPELLDALMQDDMMRVPANLQDNRVIREEESGPVFSLQPVRAALNMRYTSRPHNIVWKQDRRSQRALNLVREILMDSDALIDLRLQPGQGLVCNNILHGRHAFHDDPGYPARLVYRARFYDSIALQPAAAADGVN